MKDGDILIRQSDELLTTIVDGELIGLSVRDGICYGLNSVGTRIWELMDEPRSLETLCSQLVTEFEVGREDCREQVVQFLQSLQREGLVRVRSAGTEGVSTDARPSG